jgi:hypothetical protein
MGFYAVYQDRGGKRLWDKINHAQLKTANFYCRIGHTSQEDDGDGRIRTIGFQPVQCLKPIYFGHFDVQQNQIRRYFFQEREHFFH